MDQYQIISYPLYAGGLLEIILGIALLKKTPRPSRAMRACAGLFFSAAAFVLCTAISYTLESQGRDYNFFNRASWIGWFMIPACLQFAYYLQDENSRAARIAGYVLYPFWTVVLALTMFTDLVEPGDPSLIPFVDIDGPLEQPGRIIGAVMAIWLLIELFRAKNRLTGVKKAQFELFFYGTLFFNLGCILVAGILPLFHAVNPAFTTFFSLPWVLITYYAITRHRLFDLRLVISRLLSIAVLSLLFAAFHIVLFELVRGPLADRLAILVSLSMLGIIFFGTRFNRNVRQWMQRLVLKDRYDYQEVLLECSRAMSTILDLGDLLNFITASMKKGLGVEHVCLALREGHGVRQEMGLICPVNDSIRDWLRQTGEVVIGEGLEPTSPDDPGAMVDAYMKTMGAELLIPLVYKGEINGYLLLGQKGSGESYVQSDIDILETLAGQAAVAIENARLYAEARQAMASLRESEAKFRSLADTAAVAIFIHQGGNFLYANRAAESIGGYTADEYRDINFLGLVHPAYLDMIKARARERLRGGQAPQQYEFKIVRKDGEERWVLMTAGITTYEGNPAVIGTLIDITARKKAEEEREQLYLRLQEALQSLKESEARFRILTETTAAGIFIHRGGKIVYANPAVSKMTGYTNDEFLSLDYWAVVHPDYRELVRERARGRLHGEQLPSEYEVKIIIKNGEERWSDLSAGIIEFEGEPAIIVTLFDITERKRTEAEMVKLYEERIAEEKRHLMEKEKILMDLHDGIGGITTNISILSELAQKTSDTESVKKTLSTISRLSREGISEIRSFMHSLDTKELNWRTIATEMRSQGTTMLEPHGITFALEASLDDVQEQPGSLLWVNLFKIYKEALTNIVKHAKAGSVAVTLDVARDGLVLAVHDDGIGWEATKGSGRGLSNMRRRAEEVGGRLTTLSSGRGALVRLKIPIPIKYPSQGMAL